MEVELSCNFQGNFKKLRSKILGKIWYNFKNISRNLQSYFLKFAKKMPRILKNNWRFSDKLFGHSVFKTKIL